MIPMMELSPSLIEESRRDVGKREMPKSRHTASFSTERLQNGQCKTPGSSTNLEDIEVRILMGHFVNALGNPGIALMQVVILLVMVAEQIILEHDRQRLDIASKYLC